MPETRTYESRFTAWTAWAAQRRESLRRFAARAARFRRRNGYGVQSPFAYKFIRGVISESLAYYAYDGLALMRRRHEGRLCVSERMDKLMFRLANYVQPENAAIVGRDAGLTPEYVAAGCRKAKVEQFGKPDGMRGIRYGLCYVAPGGDTLGTFARFAPGATAGSLFVAAGIHATRGKRRDWEKIRQAPCAVVTFDIYEAGLVFFDTRLSRQNHIISF